MKKFAVSFFALTLVAAFALPAAALENQFGGYWRVRGYMQQDFTGEDQTEAQDLSRYDTRTRLYYTAVLNDNLKLVNKFEMDAVFGDGASYGDIGADGVNIEVKNSYADFNIGQFNVRVGTQPWYLARGFLFDDDGSGIWAAYKGDTFTVPVATIKFVEGGMGQDAEDLDMDCYLVAPLFNLNDSLQLNPYVVYITQDETDIDYYAFGLDLDAKFDMFSLWFTGIMESGDAGEDADFAGYLVAIGGNTNIGVVGLHSQFFYASGDDDDADDDVDAFMSTGADSYYWAEIMGYGIFDNQVSNNAPADKLENIMAFNVGASFKPMDKLKVGADIWYAALAEDDANDEDELGTEVDVRLTYELVEGLNWDIVGAILFAGDSTTMQSDDDADPIEIGSRLSLSF